LLAVKIISFILALTMIALILIMISSIFIRYNDTAISPEVVLSNQSPERHFFDMYIGNAHYHAMQVLYYGSEDAIHEGRHLRWQPSGSGYTLTTPDNRFDYAWIDYREMLFGNWDDADFYWPENWMDIFADSSFHDRSDVFTDSSFSVPTSPIDLSELFAWQSLPISEAWHDYFLNQGIPVPDSWQEYFDSLGHPVPVDWDNLFPALGLDIPENRDELIPPVDYPLFPQTIFEHSYELDISDSHSISEARLSAEQNAIRMQLDHFRYSERYLNNTDGLIYYLRRGAETALGTDGSSAYFMTQPVYLIMDSDYLLQTSHDYNAGRTWAYYFGGGFSLPFPDDDITLYLAFTHDVVSVHRDAYLETREAYINDLRIIAGAGAALIALLVILLLGAGRKFGSGGSFGTLSKNGELGTVSDINLLGDAYGSVDTNTSGSSINAGETGCYANGGSRGAVHFAVIDRPFLDVGLAFVLAWVGFMIYLFFVIGEVVWHYQNIPAMNTFINLSAIIIATPALLWLLSFVKRIKAGRFWRHTLIYFVPSRLFRFVKHHAGLMWAGFRLTGKVLIISLASFILMLIVGFIGLSLNLHGGNLIVVAMCAMFLTGVAVVFLLRYAHRIYKLERDVRNISAGAYNERISAGGGELGRIADSVNNISAGISTAVEQRMRSERLKTELITNVSHDIRTPLTSIITYTDLLKNEGLGCEKAGEYLDILIQKSLRLKTLTDELFEAAKAATGNIEVSLTDLDIVSLVNQVLGELDGAVKSSGIDLRVEMPDSLMVTADGKLMWRVLENLLSNVFKYAYPGSRAYLSVQSVAVPPANHANHVANPIMASANHVTQPIDVHANRNDAASETHHNEWRKNYCVRIELKNISAAELNIDPNELTDRFKRGDNSRTDGGSGLGLSIVQSFVAAQGGEFRISIDGDLFKAIVWIGV